MHSCFLCLLVPLSSHEPYRLSGYVSEGVLAPSPLDWVWKRWDNLPLGLFQKATPIWLEEREWFGTFWIQCFPRLLKQCLHKISWWRKLSPFSLPPYKKLLVGKGLSHFGSCWQFDSKFHCDPTPGFTYPFCYLLCVWEWAGESYPLSWCTSLSVFTHMLDWPQYPQVPHIQKAPGNLHSYSCNPAYQPQIPAMG